MPRRIVSFRPTGTGQYWRRFIYPSYPNPSGAINYSLPAWGYWDLQRSSSHPVSQLGKANYDIGGSFRVVKHDYWESVNTQPEILSSLSGAPPQPFDGYVYKGKLYAYTEQVTPSNFPPSLHSSDSTLSYYGTKAIALTIPTNPVWDLATFVGELREGLPRVTGSDFFKSRAAKARSAGSEYLNLEFGWRPLVNDIQTFTGAVRDRDKILRQYERNSGKRIKRQLRFPTERSVTIETLGGSARGFPRPVLTNGIVRVEGTLRKTTVVERERWFKGCFTYYLPKLSKQGNSERNLALANKLFGVRLTPETLWNLAPWSWAADWVANTGDVIHNINAFAHDGLIMPYAYIMERVTHHVTYELTGVGFYRNPNSRYSFRQDFVTTTKSRLQATPFGFGLNPAIDFNSRQWAILGALGLSRGGKMPV